jgi:hypothetical protein
MVTEAPGRRPETATTQRLTSEKVARMLRRADIVLTRGNGLVSRLIRRFTDSHWNHVAIVS